MTPKRPPVPAKQPRAARVTPSSLRRAIAEHGGVIADIAAHYSVTRQTIYDWLDRFEMRPLVAAARSRMREVAADVVYQQLMSPDPGAAFEAAKFVLMRMSDTGETLTLTPELTDMLRGLGLSAGVVLSELALMLSEQARESALPETVYQDMDHD